LTVYDELKDRLEKVETSVDRQNRVIHGDPENFNESPGIIAEQRHLGFGLSRTNEILEDVRGDIKDVRGDLRKINWMIIGLFIAAIGNVILKKG